MNQDHQQPTLSALAQDKETALLLIDARRKTKGALAELSITLRILDKLLGKV
jgi:hypothetical protein